MSQNVVHWKKIKGINPRVEPWTHYSDAEHRGNLPRVSSFAY